MARSNQTSKASSRTDPADSHPPGTSYVEYSTNLAAYVGDTITVKFIATEISGGDTALYEDDNALNCD